jgi:hypothetical protein
MRALYCWMIEICYCDGAISRYLEHEPPHQYLNQKIVTPEFSAQTMTALDTTSSQIGDYLLRGSSPDPVNAYE